MDKLREHEAFAHGHPTGCACMESYVQEFDKLLDTASEGIQERLAYIFGILVRRWATK